MTLLREEYFSQHLKYARIAGLKLGGGGGGCEDGGGGV